MPILAAELITSAGGLDMSRSGRERGRDSRVWLGPLEDEGESGKQGEATNESLV